MNEVPGNPLDLGRIVGREGGLIMTPELRDKHLYVVGATGSGKSKFLENLIQQDIKAWEKSQCGLLLIDPHGSLYDSLMAWLAWRPLGLQRPIIPIDLRKDDWVIAYNLLRQRKTADPAVLVANLVDAIAHVWSQEGISETPLFARWAGNIIHALYEQGHTIVETDFLTDRMAKRLRYALTSKLRDKVARSDWMFSQNLSPKDFDTQIASTVSRLRPFLQTANIRCMFGQPQVSLDLGKAIEDGAIILVSLAKEGAKVSNESANLFASLLLSDLWTAAQERGKKKGMKPFYVYLDEFQKFVSPTIAENLDEARGFGLHLTLAHQFPRQLLNQGPAGERLFDSIMENASSKVAFRLTHAENLKIMAQWLFMGVMDPDQIKHELWSTKVMNYVEEYRTSYADSTSEQEAEAFARGGAQGRGGGGTETFDVAGAPMSRSESDSGFGSESESESRSRARSVGHSQTTGTMLIPVIGKELSHVQFRDLEEQLHRAMAVLFDQRDRQCVARLVGMRAPVSLFTPTITEFPPNDDGIQDFRNAICSKLRFAMLRAKAEEQLREREKSLPQAIINLQDAANEPKTAKARKR